MKYELVEWLCINLTFGMVWSLNLGEPKLNFLFAKISFGMNVKGQGNPNSQGDWKTIIELPMNGN